MQIIIFLLYVIGILSISLIVIKITDQIKKNRLSNSSKKDERDNPIPPSTTTHAPTTHSPTTTHVPTTHHPTTTHVPTTTKHPIKYYENHTLIQTSLKNGGGIITHNKLDEHNKCRIETKPPLVSEEENGNINYYCPGDPPCYQTHTKVSTTDKYTGITKNVIPFDKYYKCCNEGDLIKIPIDPNMNTINLCPGPLGSDGKYACDTYYHCVKYPSTTGSNINHGIYNSLNDCQQYCKQPF
jgi:hypothetical protein